MVNPVETAERLPAPPYPQVLGVEDQPGIFLRLVDESDVSELGRHYSSNLGYIAKYQHGWEDGSPDATPTRVGQTITAMRAGTAIQYLIIEKDDTEKGKIVGEVSLFEMDTAAQTAHGGYLLAESASGHGYARSSTRALLQYATRDLGIHKVFFDIEPANTGSVKLTESLGAKKTGHIRVVIDGDRKFRYSRWELDLG